MPGSHGGKYEDSCLLPPCRQQTLLKRRYTSTRLHGATAQKTAILFHPGDQFYALLSQGSQNERIIWMSLLSILMDHLRKYMTGFDEMLCWEPTLEIMANFIYCSCRPSAALLYVDTHHCLIKRFIIKNISRQHKIQIV
jgi:hypothetical protein